MATRGLSYPSSYGYQNGKNSMTQTQSWL
jgi:hypothetical protein